MRDFLKFQFPALAWAILIFLASSIQSVKLPKLGIIGSDKIIHFGVFFIFGILVLRAVRAAATHSWYWRRVLIGILIVMVYGALDEYHQGFVLGRSKDILDFVADSLGACVAGILWHMRHRKVTAPPRGSD